MEITKGAKAPFVVSAFFTENACKTSSFASDNVIPLFNTWSSSTISIFIFFSLFSEFFGNVFGL